MTSFTMGFRQVRGPEHRRDKRLPLPIFSVRVDGQEAETVNWSLGGLLIGNYQGHLLVEMPVEIAIKIKDEHAEFDMKIAARVVRNDREKKLLAVKFDELNPAIYDFFERGFTKRFHRRERSPA
ncbi:MAG: PilZ domain-containing protein [Rhodospirillaceae bacterium]|nr:PilZ domain-containing protein [Rhodospirillaceae bacterium]